MPDIAAVPARFTAVRKGDGGLLRALSRIKARGHGQVLVLGLGLGAFYRNEALVPAMLGADWTTFVAPPTTKWAEILPAIKQFSALIQVDATPPRVGFFSAPAEFVREYLFRPSETGPYAASIYWLGLLQAPYRDMDVLGQLLSQCHIRAPWLECIFAADDPDLRIWEQEYLNHAIIAGGNQDGVVSWILHSLQAEYDDWLAGRFAGNPKEAATNSRQIWP